MVGRHHRGFAGDFPRNPQEDINFFLQWAERYGYDNIAAVRALRSDPTAQHVRAAIQWAKQQSFHNIAGALRQPPCPTDFPER
jgi:hypothetical protein